MKLKEAMEIAKDAEIYDAEESVFHILENHMWRFSLDEVISQLTELITDYRNYEAEVTAHYSREEAYEDERALAEDDSFKGVDR